MRLNKTKTAHSNPIVMSFRTWTDKHADQLWVCNQLLSPFSLISHTCSSLIQTYPSQIRHKWVLSHKTHDNLVSPDLSAATFRANFANAHLSKFFQVLRHVRFEKSHLHYHLYYLLVSGFVYLGAYYSFSLFLPLFFFFLLFSFSLFLSFYFCFKWNSY